MKKSLLTLAFVLGGTSLASAQQSQEVTELKAEIVSLARSYEGLPDPDGSKTKSLDILIQKLVAATPKTDMTQKATNAVGAWHQIWGPYLYNDNTQTPALDPKQIYQIISSKGTYTNVGVYHFLGFRLIGLLKGKYWVGTDDISVKFVKNGIVVQHVPKGYTLADLPALHEQDRLFVINFPSIFPPVGIRGALKEIYSDDTLRITYGSQQGKEGETLYVLERVKALEY